jgi:hypothetical protein
VSTIYENTVEDDEFRKGLVACVDADGHMMGLKMFEETLKLTPVFAVDVALLLRTKLWGKNC